MGEINGAADEFQRIEEDLHRCVLDYGRYGAVRSDMVRYNTARYDAVGYILPFRLLPAPSKRVIVLPAW